jgi:hypothetical protein
MKIFAAARSFLFMLRRTYFVGAIGAWLSSSILYAQEPASQPSSQPTSEPASEPASEPFDPDLAAALAAELGGGSDSEPSTPTPRAPVARLLPDISLNGSLIAAGFPNGASDPDLREHDPTNSGFSLQEIELAFASIVDPFFRADAIFSTGQDSIELEEGNITSLGHLPLGMQLKIGQFFTKFGRQNTQHLHNWAFADLPLTSRRMFGGDGLRDLGIEANFHLPTDKLFTKSRGEFAPPLLTSELSFAIQQGTNDVAFGEKDFAAPLSEGGLSQFLYVAHLQNFFDVSDTSGLTLGFSAAISSNNTSGDLENPNLTLLYGADLYYRHKPLQGHSFFTFTAEYILRQAQVGLDAAAVVSEDALYLQAVTRITREWEMAFRVDTVGLVSKIEGNRASLDDPEDLSARFLPRDEFRVTGAVSYYSSEFFRLRLQAGFDQSQVLGEDGVIQLANFPEVMLQANFVIGVHGAHAY